MTSAVHATAVAIDGWAVLLTGKSGSGKSDLALRLIDRGAILIGDDYVDLLPDGDAVAVKSKDAIAGKIEIRGLGIFDFPHIAKAQLRLVAELGEEGERLPSQWLHSDQIGYAIPVIKLNAFSTSAAIRIEHALKSLIDADSRPVRWQSGEVQQQ